MRRITFEPSHAPSAPAQVELSPTTPRHHRRSFPTTETIAGDGSNHHTPEPLATPTAPPVLVRRITFEPSHAPSAPAQVELSPVAANAAPAPSAPPTANQTQRPRRRRNRKKARGHTAPAPSANFSGKQKRLHRQHQARKDAKAAKRLVGRSDGTGEIEESCAASSKSALRKRRRDDSDESDEGSNGQRCSRVYF